MPTATKVRGRKVSRPAPSPEDLLGGIETGATAPVRFAAAKSLCVLSEESPESVYPHFDRIVTLMHSDNSIIRWNAIRTISNLAAVDGEHRIDELLPDYLRPICGPQMIEAATVIAGAATIAMAKPELADRLAGEVLRVKVGKYKTEECRHIAIGHAITSLDRFWPLIERRDEVLAFVEEALFSTRPSTRRKAEKFLKRHAM